MKTRLRFLLLSFMVAFAAIAVLLALSLGREPDIRIEIRSNAVASGIVEPQSEFFVVFTNMTDDPIRLWEEWNSWGAFNLSFDLVDENGLATATIQKGPMDWAKNYPSYLEIEAGKQFNMEVDLTKKVWRKPARLADRGGQRLVAKYTSAPCEECDEHNVWIGHVSSLPRAIEWRPGSQRGITK